MATILVVDDRAVNRELMKTVLGYRGHTVLEAQDGEEALELAKTCLPQLIISDVLMPTMDGFEFARQLRQHPAICGTPLIFSSAHYPRAESRALATAYGVHTILTKPCDPQVILDAVDEMLGKPVPVDEIVTRDEEFNYEHLRLVTDKLSRRNDELRAANLKVTKLIEIGQRMIQEKEPLHLVREYCGSAREIIGAECAGLGLMNDDEPGIKLFCVSGLEPEIEAQIVSSIRCEGVIAEIVKQRVSRRLHELPGVRLDLGLPSALPPISSFVGVPIASATRVYGWLCLSNKLGADQFSQTDEELLNLLATQLGVSYENARLYREAKCRTDELEKEVSERRRIEETLRESELRYKTLAETANDAIFICGVDGTMQYINTEGARWFGMSTQEVVGKSQHELFSIRDADRNLQLAAKISQTGQPIYDEAQREFQGQEVWQGTWLAPIKDKDGSVSAIMGIARDITEQIHIKEKLSLLATAVEQSGNTIVIVDTQGDIQYVNPAFEQTTGYSREEVIGKNPRILKGGNHTEEYYKDLWETITNGIQWTGNFTNRKKDGTLYLEEATISPVRDKAGRIISYVAVKQDVTQRMRAEEDKARLLAQVQDQKQRIDNIVTNVPGVVWEAWGQPDAASQRIDFVSDYVEQMLGYTVEEWLSTPNFWLTIVHPDDKENTAREAAAIYASRRGGVNLFRWITKDGRARWMEAHMTVVCDDAGNPIGMRGVTLDVSERKQAEEAIAKAHNFALETARVKAEFLSNMSHELRTPMNGIIGFTGLMLETDLTEEQRTFLGMVTKSADSMMVLIDNVLTFSESDPDRVETCEFSLEEHIHESVMAFSVSSKNKGLSLSYQISPDVPATLVGDPERLSKILRLLVDNAVKFTDRGDIVVNAAVESCATDEIGLVFTVRDTGIGIPDDRHEMIFNPFTQVDGSSSRKYGGAGLGLAICRHLVEMVGDRLWVESEPGRGSAFHFTARFKLSPHSKPDDAATSMDQTSKRPNANCSV